MSDNDKIGIELVRNNWCHTARIVRIFGVHNIIFVPVLVTAVHLRVWTIYCVIIVAVALVLIERQGYSPRVCALLIKSRLSGNRVSNTRKLGSRRLWRR